MKRIEVENLCPLDTHLQMRIININNTKSEFELSYFGFMVIHTVSDDPPMLCFNHVGFHLVTLEPNVIADSHVFSFLFQHII